MASIRLTIACTIVLVTTVGLLHQFSYSRKLIETLTVHAIKVVDETGIDPSLFERDDDPHALLGESFCVGWSQADAMNRSLQPIDEWWTHRADFEITSENETHVCFKRDDTASPRTTLAMQLYHNQFHTTCEKVHKRYQWSSGWGADFKPVLGGLLSALDKYHVPLVMTWNPAWPEGWDYASYGYERTNRTCPEADLTCYFLPFHPCGKYHEVTNHTVGDPANDDLAFPNVPRSLHAYQFVTRPLWWVRRSVHDFIHKHQQLELVKGHCSVVHVRRNDVVQDRGNSRRYFPVQSYVDLLPEDVRLKHDILLLTDDQNAISEALEFYPDMKWKYMDRPRHHGAAGWGSHTPSGDPALETIAILSTFELVKSCVNLVHSASAFSDFLWAYMQTAAEQQDDYKIARFMVDAHLPFEEKISANNNASAVELQQLLEQMRQEKRQSNNSRTASEEQGQDPEERDGLETEQPLETATSQPQP